MTDRIEETPVDGPAGLELAAPPRVAQAVATLAWLFIVGAATVWGDSGWTLHRFAVAPNSATSCWVRSASARPAAQSAATYSAACLLPPGEGRRGG
jgi:hypothetical protein